MTDKRKGRIIHAGTLRDEQVFPPGSLARKAAGIEGRPVDGEPDDVASHFYTCKACGQAVDMRDLGQVFHHEEQGHEPLPES